MSDTVIRVENLGKKYVIGHQRQERYATLRDVVTHNVRSWGQRILHPGQAVTAAGQATREEFWALKDVSFEVKRGERLGIIGRNGAGKSTLLKILARITEPTTGRVGLRGRVGSLLEVGTGFHPELTGRENVYMNGTLLGMTKAEVDRKFDEIVDFSGVERFIDTPVKRYSSGMHVRLAFSVAAHLEPEILLVDEVLAVGDVDFQKKCLGRMQTVAEMGRTVLFVSHNIPAITNLCRRSILLARGETVMDGETSLVVSHYLSSEKSDGKEPNLASITNRTGTQAVSFVGFHVEDSQGRTVDTVSSGDDVTLVFRLKVSRGDVKKIDVGFRLHSALDTCLVVLYSSFQGIYWESEDLGYKIVKCRLADFPFAPGRITVKGRILVGNEESDWPRPPIGVINVIDGDFYETGKSSQVGGASFLLKGSWE